MATSWDTILRRRGYERFPPRPALWVLGIGERGVTVRNQQVRAINLMCAARELLGAGARVAIVGGVRAG